MRPVQAFAPQQHAQFPRFLAAVSFLENPQPVLRLDFGAWDAFTFRDNSMASPQPQASRERWSVLHAAILRKAELYDVLDGAVPHDWSDHICRFASSVRQDCHLLPQAMTTLLLDVAVHVQRRFNHDGDAFVDGVIKPASRRDVSDPLAHREVETCLLRWVQSREPKVLVQHMQAVRIADHINNNLSQPLSTQYLATVSGWSGRHLERCFRSAFGMTIRRYVTRQRMRRAAELLTSGSKMEAAMWEVGYKNKTHFSRAFVQHIGLTPGQCRGRRTPGTAECA